MAMMSTATFSWQSVLFMEETGVPGENNRPVASHYLILNGLL